MDVAATFSDIEPIDLNEADDAVCKITYAPDASVAFSYLRALIQSGECSKRALQLTTVCLKWNQSNYTTWHFRRRCIAALEYDIMSELKFVTEMAGSNPKNYQIWYHRRALIESKVNFLLDKESSLMENELAYIDDVLEADAKNYHAWSNRKWLVKTYFDLLFDPEEKPLFPNDTLRLLLKLRQSEFDCIDALISNDVRNNSAWNYRWFVAHLGYDLDHKSSIINTEIKYAIDCIKVDPFNESPWQYFLGYAFENKMDHKLMMEMEEKIRDLKDLDDEDLSVIFAECPQLMAAHAELLILIKSNPESLIMAQRLCEQLSTKYDPTRAKYWSFRSKECIAIRK